MDELRRTWDGLEVAPDRPHGSTVVVRRLRPDGSAGDYLVLHRNARGPDYEGDWAWTPPAGARQPGEAVYPAALRELEEEAGMTGLAPWAVDLSGDWAIFAVDVAAEAQVRLVDPEHDRFAWVPAADARASIRPAQVAASGVGRVEEIAPVAISFTAMTDADLVDLVRWRSADHVVRWYGAPLADVDAARRLYARRLRGESPTRMWVARNLGRAIGFVQDYPVAAYEDLAVKVADDQAIGFDYLIGEPSLVGRGLGTAMIWSFLRDVLCRDYPDAPRFMASPDHRNSRSLRALAKCGFTPGLWIDMPKSPQLPASTEIVCTLSRTHWFG